MDELFKELGDYEQKGAYQDAEWTKLEARLKGRRRRRAYLWLAALIPLLVLAVGGIRMLQEGEQGGVPEVTMEKSLAPVQDNESDVGHEFKGSREAEEEVVNTEEMRATQPADVSGQHRAERETHRSDKGGEPVVIRPLAGSTHPEKSDAEIAGTQHDILSGSAAVRGGVPGEGDVQDRDRVELMALRSAMASLAEFDLIERHTNWEGPGWKRFRLSAGLRASMTRSVAVSTTSKRPFAAGGYLKLDYYPLRRLGISLQPGFHAEVNQQLSYDYLAQREVFLESSEQYVSIVTHRIYSAFAQLSAFYHWGKKQRSGLGGYYNRVLQSHSDISVNGTGRFSNTGVVEVNQGGYFGLLAPHDFGAYLYHNVRFDPLWEIALEGYWGFSNRINETYYPEASDIRRREVSITLIRRLR